MSQKTRTGDKKGAKTSNHVGQPARGSSAPAEESKASQPTQLAKQGNNKRLRKNLDEKVQAQPASQSSRVASNEARQNCKSNATAAAKGPIDKLFKQNKSQAQTNQAASKASQKEGQKTLIDHFKSAQTNKSAQSSPTKQQAKPKSTDSRPPCEPKPKQASVATESAAAKTDKAPKSTSQAPAKQPKEPKPESEIAPEVKIWKDRREQFSQELQACVEEAQKERETWLSSVANSNSNRAEAPAQFGEQTPANSQSRPESISDQNTLLLCQKIRENTNLDPQTDSVQFLIVKFLAGHIEQSKTPAESNQMTKFFNKINFERVLLQNAQRKAYGDVPKHHDVFADETPNAIWSWELAQPTLYLEPPAYLRDVLQHRESMQSRASLIQSIQKLLRLIEKAKQVTDLTGVSNAQVKYNKLIQKRKQTAAKLQAKAMKEQIRLQAEEEKKRQLELERQEKENERLAREQERIRQKQEKEQALLQEKQEKKRLLELEKRQREEAKEQERLAKEKTREQERIEREAAKERERIEKEEKKQQLENERLEKKRKQEEAAKLAQDLREQQRREKQEKEAAELAAKEKQKLTNFFGNQAAGGGRAQNGVSSVHKQSASKAISNKKLIGGNQIKNDIRQALTLEQPSLEQESEQCCFQDYSVLTEAHQIQRAFRLRFPEAELKPKPEYTPQLLLETMKIYTAWHRSLIPRPVQSSKSDVCSQSTQNKQGSQRPKVIIIEDSHSNFLGRYFKKSSVITARNPFKKDEQLFDYDMDSEDEEAEQNGEDIEKKDIEEEQEDEEMANEEEEEPGFIVSDGHLSINEYDFSQDYDHDDDQKQKEIALRRERLKQQRQQQQQVPNGTKQSYCIVHTDTTSSPPEQLKEFAILTFEGVNLPLSVKKPEKIYDFGQGDPNAILKFRAQLIRACYSSLESKQQIIDDFNDKYPECSKKSIERVFKDIIIKEKREGDLRPAWYATEAILAELTDFQQSAGKDELLALAKERMRPLVEEAELAEAAKNEEIKIREELKRLERAQREAEREQKERERQLEKERQHQQKEAERLEREALKEAERQAREFEKQKERELKDKQKQEELEQRAAEKEKKRLEKEQAIAQKTEEEAARKAAKLAAKLEKEKAAAQAKQEKEELKKLKAEQKMLAKQQKEKEKEKEKQKEKEKKDKKQKSTKKAADKKQQMSLDVSLKTAAPSMTIKPDEKEQVTGKRADAPETAQALLNAVGSPQKESSVIPQTGSSKKLDKKQVSTKKASSKDVSQGPSDPGAANAQKPRKRESKAKEKEETQQKKTGRASKAQKDSAVQQTEKEIEVQEQKFIAAMTESEDTNKIKTMPQSSDKKSGEASNGCQAAAQLKASPVSQKKVLLQEAVMNAKTGDLLKPVANTKATPTKQGDLLQILKRDTPQKCSQLANSQRSATSANRQNSALKQGTLFNFVGKK